LPERVYDQATRLRAIPPRGRLKRRANGEGMPSAEECHPFEFRLERTIHVRRAGPATSGPLTVGPIRWLSERGTWACYWSIHVIHSEEARLYGDDPIQALDRTLEFITNLIHGSIEDGFTMWWQSEGDGCGFGPTT
jgi:hypothetical protein